MESNHNSSEGTFLSSGGSGYRATSPRKPDIKAVVQHIRQCRDEITHNVLVLQQAALEQERLEAYYEQLSAGVKVLIGVIEDPGKGAVLTSEWIQRRDEAIRVVDMILDEAGHGEAQEKK